MSASTYGLTTSTRAPASGGETLLGLGSAQKKAGMALLGNAAEADTKRQIQNKQMEQEAQAGNTQLGATAGAQIGTMVSPGWGTLIGGALGAIAGHYF